MRAAFPTHGSTVVTSIDRQRGVPTFAWAGSPPPAAPPSIARLPEATARFFLQQRSQLYRIDDATVSGARLRHVHDTGRGGIIVTFEQRLGGIEIFRSECKVLLNRHLELIAIGGHLRKEPSRPMGPFTLSTADAIAQAFDNLHNLPLSASNLVGQREAAGGYQEFDLSPTQAIRDAKLTFVTPARGKPVLFPLPATLVPAYYLEIDGAHAEENHSELYAYVIAANDGRVLFRQSLTHSEKHSYRVFADDDGELRPLDGPIADHTPHPNGTPDGSYPAFVAPVLVSVDGLNTNPANTFDPWLLPGAVDTRGNNVDAYTDSAPQGFSTGDLRATLTSANTFDHVFDTAADALVNDDQRMASITQLFFVNNWLHDYYYDSGFDEAAGNAQKDNFGRGGFAGDPLLAEGQDNAPGSMNNANMSTPADGKSPRMQMFIYSGESSRSLQVEPLNQSLNIAGASFGPTNFDVTAIVVLADDNAGNTADACQPIQNDLTGKIALIDRGSCTFVSKVQRAETAGALGVIIANHQGNQGPPPLGGNGNTGIGAVSVSLSDGNAIKQALNMGEVSATLKQFNGPRRDGTIDNLIVAHEWGHYIHHRLVKCSSRQCSGQSEGWGDFFSLMTSVRQGDDLEGSFAAAIYAPVARQDPGYFGIRRAPYSIDMGKNGFTFKHISAGVPLPNTFPQQGTSNNNAEVHNTGEIWTSMLFEGYVGLLQRSQQPNAPYTFSEARRRMADYIVAGMKLAPADPTFTEQRDAILANAAARDFEDMMILANGFAKRGAGSCAVAPPRDVLDNVGVVESYEVGPALKIGSVDLDESLSRCDEDGVLDAGEVGLITIVVSNNGPIDLEAATLTLNSDTKGVTIENDGKIVLDPLAPLSVATVTVQVSVDPSLEKPTPFEFDIVVDAPGACNPSFTKKVGFRLNYDDVPETETSDDFESGISVWTPKGEESNNAWSRDLAEPLNTVWQGIDTSHITDTNLESPPLEVSGTEDLVLTLVHRHSFEVDDEPTYWDGGVIEISNDDGQSWDDALVYQDPGYGGPLSNKAENPLSDQMAFAATNPSWPQTDEVTVNFGDAFAGETVRIRFRIGTDQAAGDVGWFIHRVALSGITNTPFPAIVDDATSCNPLPIADAGPDQDVHSGDDVELDGSDSHDPEDKELTYAWKQLGESTVTLSEPTTATPRFVAPKVDEEIELSFELTVSSGFSSATDTVIITVSPATMGVMTPIIIRSCGCSLPGKTPDPRGPASVSLLMGLALMLRRRSRT